MKNGQPTTDNEEQDADHGGESSGAKKSMKGEDIAERLLDFAVRILTLGSALPKTPVGKHLCGQIVRCGTSPGAHYEEGRGAESRADFVHKLGICLKELRETRYWLKVIARTKLIAPKRMNSIIQEADELCRIVGKSILTAKRKDKTSGK